MSNLINIPAQLVRAYNLKNVKVVDARKNPFENKIPGAVQIDPELYKSSLGTPVFSDITFGDKVNQANNQWTDNAGKLHSFEPMTFYSVLMSVTIPKKIVRTEIQGRDGSVKEYIGQGDYSVSVNGIICGSNGHYPIDEVKALKKIIDAPIPIVVTSWYLQNLDIDMLIIGDGAEISQDSGGYSYQQFSIPCISDIPIELKISDAF